MFGLTNLGIVHTAISLVAVAAGVACFLRDGEIPPDSTLGRLYFWTTLLTCLTGFGIFQHGGFGKAHVLGVLTLLTLALAFSAQKTSFFGRATHMLITICYTTTFLFHMIPAITETMTRLPAGHPIFSSAEAPGLMRLTGVLIGIYCVGIFFQVRMLRRHRVGKILTSRS